MSCNRGSSNKPYRGGHGRRRITYRWSSSFRYLRMGNIMSMRLCWRRVITAYQNGNDISDKQWCRSLLSNTQKPSLSSRLIWPEMYASRRAMSGSWWGGLTCSNPFQWRALIGYNGRWWITIDVIIITVLMIIIILMMMIMMIVDRI